MSTVSPFGDVGFSPGDLASFWLAARAFVAGANPYSLVEIQTLFGEYPGIQSVFYPPLLFPFIAPFALFEQVVLQVAWFVASLLLVMAGVRTLVESFGLEWRRVFLLTISFQPLALNLFLGQLVPIFFLSLCLTLAALKKGKSSRAGIALAFTAVKPHLLWLLYFVQLRRKQARVLFSFCAALAVLSVLPVLLNPKIYLHFLSRSEGAALQWHNPTVGAWIMAYTGGAWSRFVPMALVVFAFPLLVRRGADLVLGSIVLSVLTTPYLWTYDLLMLLPPLLLLFARQGGQLFLLVVVINVLQWFTPGPMKLTVWYVVTLGVVCLWKILHEHRVIALKEE